MRKAIAQQLTFQDAPVETVIDLPPPISVNATRKIDKKALGKHWVWIQNADKLIYAAGGLKYFKRIPGKFSATLIIDERHTRADLDNCVKHAIDYARRIRLITNDDKRYLRRVTIEWGHAPEGCRLILKEIK